MPNLVVATGEAAGTVDRADGALCDFRSRRVLVLVSRLSLPSQRREGMPEGRWRLFSRLFGRTALWEQAWNLGVGRCMC